jgi:putative endonuclease
MSVLSRLLLPLRERTLAVEPTKDYCTDWYVYILLCADSTLYTGITTDPERRVQEHNTCNKKGARYTRARRPVRLLWQETHTDRASASRREYQIKKMSAQKKRALMNLAD